MGSKISGPSPLDRTPVRPFDEGPGPGVPPESGFILAPIPVNTHSGTPPYAAVLGDRSSGVGVGILLPIKTTSLRPPLGVFRFGSGRHI